MGSRAGGAGQVSQVNRSDGSSSLTGPLFFCLSVCLHSFLLLTLPSLSMIHPPFFPFLYLFFHFSFSTFLPSFTLLFSSTLYPLIYFLYSTLYSSPFLYFPFLYLFFKLSHPSSLLPFSPLLHLFTLSSLLLHLLIPPPFTPSFSLSSLYSLLPLVLFPFLFVFFN